MNPRTSLKIKMIRHRGKEVVGKVYRPTRIVEAKKRFLTKFFQNYIDHTHFEQGIKLTIIVFYDSKQLYTNEGVYKSAPEAHHALRAFMEVAHDLWDGVKYGKRPSNNPLGKGLKTMENRKRTCISTPLKNLSKNY